VIKENKNKISIIFPVYNEEKALPKILGEWQAILKKNKIPLGFMKHKKSKREMTALPFNNSLFT
jgi:hypothetical protein